MDTLTPLVQEKIKDYLPPGQQPRVAALNSCSKTGEAGESWLIATNSHLLVGSQSLTGDMEFEAYPLAKMSGIERDTHGLGRGKLVFLSGQDVLDQIEYSALDSEKFQTVDQEILALVRRAGGRATPPPVPQATTAQADASPPPAPAKATTKIEKPAPQKPPGREKTKPRRRRIPVAALPKPPEVKLPHPPEPPVPQPPKAPARKEPRQGPPPRLRSAGGRGSPDIAVLLPSTKLSPGDPVPARVNVRQQRPVTCRGVRLHFRGVEQTKITHGRGSDRSTSREQHIIVDEEHVLFGHRSQPMEDNFADALATVFSSGKYPKLPAGKHEWDTRLSIPEGALPSYVGRHGSVNYSVKAYVDVPMAFDVAKHVNLLVLPEEARSGYRFMPLAQEKRGILQLAPSAPGLMLHVEVDELRWAKERKIRGRLRFENPRRVEIRGVKVTAELTEQAHAGSRTRLTKVGGKQAYSRLSFNGEEFPWQRFSVPVPRDVPPFAGRFLRVDLILTVSLELPMRGDVSQRFVAEPVR